MVRNCKDRYLDIALDCAADNDAEPATLIRAARDFAAGNPAGTSGDRSPLLSGRGYESSPVEIDLAVDHLMAASRRFDRRGWAIEQLRHLVQSGPAETPMARRLRYKLSAVEEGSELRGG